MGCRQAECGRPTKHGKIAAIVVQTSSFLDMRKLDDESSMQVLVRMSADEMPHVLEQAGASNELTINLLRWIESLVKVIPGSGSTSHMFTQVAIRRISPTSTWSPESSSSEIELINVQDVNPHIHAI